jgi:hypothetical protein
MSAIVAILLSNLVPVVATGIAGVVGLGIHWLTSKLAKKLDAEQFASALDDCAMKAVLSVEQSIVDPMIKSGEWGKPESYSKALTAGVDSLKALMPDLVDKLTKAGIADANAYVATIIESKIKQVQLSQQAIRNIASISVPAPVAKP